MRQAIVGPTNEIHSLPLNPPPTIPMATHSAQLIIMATLLEAKMLTPTDAYANGSQKRAEYSALCIVECHTAGDA